MVLVRTTAAVGLGIHGSHDNLVGVRINNPILLVKETL